MSRLQKVQINLVQTAVIVVAMGILLSEQDIKEQIKKNQYAGLIKQFQMRYSVHFADIVSDILSKHISTFRELQARINGTRDDGGEGNDSASKEYFKISPPIDFEGEIYKSMGNESKIESRDGLGKGVYSDSKSSSFTKPPRYLGADGPIRKIAYDNNPNEEYRLVDIHSRINGGLNIGKLTRQHSDTYGSASRQKENLPLATESSKQLNKREETKRYEPYLIEKGSKHHTPTTNYRSMELEDNSRMHTPIGNGQDSSSNARHIKETRYTSDSIDRYSSDNHNLLRFDDRHDKISVVDLNKSGAKTAEAFYPSSSHTYEGKGYQSMLTKGRSAVEFHPKVVDQMERGKDDTTVRVSELFNKLNSRFKKYHEEFESSSKENNTKNIKPELKENLSSFRMYSPKRETKRDSKDIAGEEGHVGGYSPFNISNTKLKLKEEREHQYTSIYLRNTDDSKHTKSSHISPRSHIGVHKNLDAASSNILWRPSVKTSAYKDSRRAPYQTEMDRREEIAYNNEPFNDKKKNRSVSFNLSGSHQGIKSLSRTTHIPKSILKNKQTTDEETSAFDPYSQPSLREPYQTDLRVTDFTIHPTLMREEQRQKRNQSSYGEAYHSTSPFRQGDTHNRQYKYRPEKF